jgi:hypothetical protein
MKGEKQQVSEKVNEEGSIRKVGASRKRVAPRG